jgi:phenylpropionate dioxygenase-like ring-hydroxylating dioxygenase large terminal subunit
MIDGRLRCGYHGWEFSGDGSCRRVPGRSASLESRRSACVPSLSAVESGGLIWVQPTPAAGAPYRHDTVEQEGYQTEWFDFGTLEAPFHALLDNFMDSFHPPFIHAGLLTSNVRPQPTRITIRPFPLPSGGAGLEAVYQQQERTELGLLGRILSGPPGDAPFHAERYLPPTFHQIEHRTASRHLVTTQYCVPESDSQMRLFVVLSLRSPFPRLLLRPILRHLVRKLTRQDIEAVVAQVRNRSEFPDASSSSTERKS